jgi:hypothetical protein
MGEPDGIAALEQELKRVRVKLVASDDRDIRQALQFRVEGLEAKIAELRALAKAKEETAAPELESDEQLPEATPDQIRKADDLIRQARVEKMRKNGTRAAILMKEAGAIAPTSPAVLEVLGDELIEQKKYKDARDIYARALRFAKNNVELEKKHALAALRAKGMSSFDAAMRSNGSDPLFLTSEDSLASGSGALWLNAFMPGVGHLAVGKTATGIALIVSVVVWVIWLKLMDKDLVGLFSMVKGVPSHPNLLVLVPLFGMVVTYIIGFTSLGVQPKLKPSRSTPHPQPPMDLPFE